MSKDMCAAWAPRWRSLLRIVAALLFMQHGLMKYFGFPGPHPHPFHVPPSALFAAAGAIEIIGGALLALGLFSRIAAFIMAGEMAVAYFTFHLPHSFYPLVNHGELAILFCFIFFYIAVAGPGPWSLDAKRG